MYIFKNKIFRHNIHDSNTLFFSQTLISGLDDWNDTDVLTQVLAASQQEYLNSLKKAAAAKESESRSRRSSSDSSDQERDQNNPNKNNKNNAS